MDGSSSCLLTPARDGRHASSLLTNMDSETPAKHENPSKRVGLIQVPISVSKSTADSTKSNLTLANTEAQSTQTIEQTVTKFHSELKSKSKLMKLASKTLKPSFSPRSVFKRRELSHRELVQGWWS